MPTLNIFSRPTPKIVATGVLVSVLLAALFLSVPSFTSLNNQVTDLVTQGAGQKSPSGNVIVIDLDDESIARFGQWPWPRYRLAHLLQKVSELGARSIALDMILAEPDRTSPVRVQEEAERYLGYKIEIGNLPAEYKNYDDYLARTLTQGPFVLGYEFLFRRNGDEKGDNRLHPLRVVVVQQKGLPAAGEFFEASGVVGNLEPFARAVSSSGFLNATPDRDGILRRLPLLIRYKGELFPSLSLAAFMRFKATSAIQLLATKAGSIVVLVGDRSIPIDRQGNVLIDFRARTGPIPRFSAADLLEGRIPGSAIAGKIALVGSSAAGLDKTYQIPGNPVFSHVGIHAHMLEDLLTGEFPQRDQRFLFWEAGVSLLLGLLFSLLVARTGVISSAVAGGIIIISLWMTARGIFHATGYVLSPLQPTMVIVAAYAVLTIVKTREGQNHAEETAGNALMLLKRSESQLNSIIQSIPDIIFRLDPSGNVSFVSPAIAQYKRDANELLGRPIFDLVLPEDRQKATYRVNERRTGRRATRDLQLRLLLNKEQSTGSADEQRYFSVSAQGLYQYDPSRETFIGTQGIIRDITEQKKLEERLLQAQKMEAVGSLAAGVAHDLNNILSGLVSYPDLLLLDIPEGSPLRAKIKAIKRSGQRAAAIVQDMLTLARRGVAHREIFCPNRIIQEYLESPEFARLKEKHLQIAFEAILSPDLLNVKGSPLHLTKGLMNLVTNAVEALPAGGRVVISTANSYLDTARQVYEEIPEGEYVCLSVEDNGVGISPEDLQRVFEPFYTKKRMGGSGSGLGMTVIWATVKDQGGYIDLQSAEGEGTRIDIYLPATRETIAEKDRRIVLQDYLGNEKILVVDDIREQREIAVNMLSKLGYKVFSATSGETALALIRDNPVDLVVLDMIMPNGIDGLETYQAIVSLYPGQKAIIASGYSESDRVKELQRLGAGVYIQKPYTMEKIGVAVRTELDKT
ncbi:MAG TPA: CHASE2 domain-containing protein [Thermodesulfovibrionales bacterium]|nr:CHASE2 domain-containing protein [Thermodesulfovibrionales bacterium]